MLRHQSNGKKIKLAEEYKIGDNYKYDNMIETIIYIDNEYILISNEYHGNTILVHCKKCEKYTNEGLLSAYDYTSNEICYHCNEKWPIYLENIIEVFKLGGWIS